MGWFSRLMSRFGGQQKHALPAVVSDDGEPQAFGPATAARYAYHDGDKFPGGFGTTEILITDYWTLRTRSAALFERNIYARGLIRRLVTNVINTGLHLEATPSEAILGVEDGSLEGWTEFVERMFELWGKNPALCDYLRSQTFGALQASMYREALICGDVLVVLSQDKRTKLPLVRIVSGSSVRTPFPVPKVAAGHSIRHGVELDASGGHVAYWIRKPSKNGREYVSERLAAHGAKTGRRVAWLVYGTDKRLDDVRGMPALALMLQLLKELDRFRDATIRKALLQAYLAIFVTKTEDKPGTRPITGGAVRKTTETVSDSAGTRSWNAEEFMPGLIVDELQTGEEPKAFQTQATSEGFGEFEEAMVQAFAWAHEIPPEILRLAFSNNYSASQAAINEFKMFLNVVRTRIGNDFCDPIYREWMLAHVLAQKVEAPGLLESWRGQSDFYVFASWVDADWSGAIKPAVDAVKLAKAYALMVEQGFITRERATRELTGTKHSQNVRKLLTENAALAEANEPLNPAPEPDTQGDGEAEDPDNENEDKSASGTVVRVAASG